MEKYYGIEFIIDGIYGEITYCSLTNHLDNTFNEYVANNTKDNMPEVKFNVLVKDDAGTYLFRAYDIKGLPKYLNLDMGTYYRMAKLREIRNINVSCPAPKIDFQKISDEVVKRVAETLESISYKNKTNNV